MQTNSEHWQARLGLIFGVLRSMEETSLGILPYQIFTKLNKTIIFMYGNGNMPCHPPAHLIFPDYGKEECAPPVSTFCMLRS
jgi:hypothetical protein